MCEIEQHLKTLEIMSKNTDDYLFLLDIKADRNWFFGDWENNYDIIKKDGFSDAVKNILKITHPNDRQSLMDDLNEVASGTKPTHEMNYRWINRNGETVWINCRASVVNDKSGEPSFMIGRISEDVLKFLYNSMTGLFNKNKLLIDFKEKFPFNNKGYLMLLDIDDLSAINLSYGREYGNSLLKNIAEIMEALSVAEGIYHIEPNYFAVYLNTETEQDVRDIYECLQRDMYEKCTLTAGVVPMDSNVFTNEANLYYSAKLTLKKAKIKGKNTIEFFSEEEIKKHIYEVKLLEELQESVSENFNGFEVEYQPQVKAGNYNIYSVETLIRYSRKNGERVYPDNFIGLLEKSRLIIPVGLWVLENALLQCREWRKTISDMRVSVNFSTVQFSDCDIIEKVLGVLKKTGMPGSALTIEITESIPLNEIAQFRTIINHLKDAGIQIAIDDFGTGYSNIAYLKQLDIDEIKIDRMFVSGIETDTYNYKVIDNTMEFAKINSIRICCEGVENIRELSVLESLSPDILQGYFFSKPCSAEAFYASYINPQTTEYKKRIEFISDIYKYKEDMNTIRFEPEDILRETDVGLWIIRINEETGCCELHPDETMERIMGVDKKYTPQECYDFWFARIKAEHIPYVQKNMQVMTELDRVVQLQYAWRHPLLGEVTVRSNGRRVEDVDGWIVIEGYHRILSNIEEV